MRYRFLRFPEGKSRAVSFSFDDGISDDVRLIELFKKYGFKGTFNLNSQLISDEDGPFPRRLNKEEVRSLYYQNGMEVAAHGCRHLALHASSSPVYLREFLEDRIALEKLFGRIISGSVLPDDGRINAEQREHLRALGFRYNRGGYDESFCLPEDWMDMKPATKHNSPRMHDVIRKFINYIPEQQYISQRESRWCLIWGHSHELRGQNNWELIDEIGEVLGGHDDIWYATNGEICDYCLAYRALQWSADDSIVYNPTLYTIFFEVDTVPCVIHSGKTLHFD